MLRRLRSLLVVLTAAVLGAVIGRLLLDTRRRMEDEELAPAFAPAQLRQVRLRVQDVIPGLVAAFRVKDAPWSWFHIPSWLAAFAVNLGVGALGGDMARLREQAERTVFEYAGLDPRDFGLGGDDEDARDVTATALDVEVHVQEADGDGASAPPPSTPSPGAPPPNPAPNA